MKPKITFFLLFIILFTANLVSNKIFAQTISASSTSSTCINNGTIMLTGTDVPTPVVYGIAQSPYNEPDVISSSSPSFTMLEPGDYFYGYFSGGAFIKSATTVNVANNYNATSPTFSNYVPIFYSYCGATDPLGTISATVTGGNKPYNVQLIDSNNNIVQQLQTQSSVSFTGLAAGNYTLRATDACGTIVLAPNTITLKPNIPYTDFTLASVIQQPSTSFFNVVYSSPNDVCSAILSATVTNISYILGLGITDITTPTGVDVPQYYGAKNPVYKIEIQNASGSFDVFDNLTVSQAYSTIFTLPTDRSKWGLIRASVTLCGITKTNQLDLALYNEFKQIPLSFVSTSIYDDPNPVTCTAPTQVQFTTNLYQSGGCQPITLDVTEKGTSNTQHYELPFNFSFKLDIGKTYVIVIKDATGQELPGYVFRNYTTSPSSKPPQSDPNNLYIDPAYFTPLSIQDKITFTDGPSSKNIGKSVLIVSNITTTLGLVAPVHIQSISGPSAINKTLTPTSSTYYVGLGNDLLPGTYKIRVTDSQCFTADYDIELASYFVSVALQNVTSEPSPITCDRYIKKGQIRVTAVGKTLGGNPDIIRYVYGYDSVFPRLLKIPTGATVFASNSTNFTLNGDDTISFSYTADLSGNYELALSRQNDNRLVLPSEIFENTTTVPLEVLPNFPSFDLTQSGGVICTGNTTGNLTVKINNTIGTVNYFIKKDTDTDFPATGQTSATFTDLTSGNYIVKAKTSCFEVVQPFTLKPATEIGDIIIGDNTYCTGSNLILSTIGLGPLTSIVWTLPDNSTLNSAGLTINNLTTANSGLYSVQVVTSAGCTLNGTITVTVNASSEAAFPIFNAASPPLICQSVSPQIIDYTATAANSTSITYSITPTQAGTISNGAQSGIVEWNSSFNGTATITATAAGCGSSKATDFTVIVSPRSNATDIIAEGRTICPNETAIILNALAPTISNPFFTWYDSNLSSASILGTGDNFVVSPTITTTYYVGVEGDDLCLNDTGNRKAVTVTVNPVATVGDIDVTDQIICKGETATLTASSLLINPVFKWYTDASLTNLISNIETINVNPAITTTYYVTVEADGICAIPPPAKAVTVTVNPLLVAAGTASTACASDGSGYVLTLSVTGEAPYSATGTGAPGTWFDNTWTSGAITAGTNYNVSIQDVYVCNTLVIADVAPICCFFDVVCPTFPTTTITCYNQLPIAATLTKAEFEALGNGDGTIGNTPCGIIEITASNGADPGCNGNITRTYTVTEYADPNNNKIRDAGENTVLNTSNCTQTIILDKADFVMPINDGSTFACAASIVPPTVPIVTDNCGNNLTPSTPIISEIPTCDGIVTYTYTFTDCKGNTHDWIYTYTIDKADFVMPINDGSTVACAASIVPPTVPIVTDNCGNALTPSNPIISATPTCDGTVTYTYTFTDCKGNTHDWIYTYTIDKADFVMPINDGSTVACAASIVPPTVPIVTDNCGNALTPSNPIISEISTCDGIVTYTYTFTDCKGNTHDWVYTYIINNTIAPTGTAPVNLSLQCIEDVPIANINDVTNVTSNCNGTTIVTLLDNNNGGTGCAKSPYIVTRTYTITDCGGLSTNLVQTITVTDTTAPVFIETLPSNITLDCSATIPAAVTLTATDNCSTATVTYNEVRIDGTCSGNYQLQRTWTATDACGNETTHTQVVTIADTTAPVFAEPLPVAIIDVNCETIPATVILTATDTCGIATVNYTETKVNGDCTSKYSLLRTWVASDNCGNETTYTQTINVSCLAEVKNAISPNGDGMNDILKIEGIDCFPNNSVEIFNRYGNAVYKKDNYDNVNNPFAGFSDGRATVKRGDKLPTGTYFYILRYDDNGNRVEKSGYLYISN